MEPPSNFFILLVLTISIPLSAFSAADMSNAGDNLFRRILHQPLFPTDPPAPPAQPFPTATATPSQDTPFFHSTPPGPPTNPTPIQTPSVSVPSNASEQGTVQSRSEKPAGKIFTAASLSVVAMIFVLALVCFIYHRRARNSSESEKLVGREDAVRHENEPSEPVRAPPPETSAASHFLYIGTVEASRGRSGEIKSSPYHRLRESQSRPDLHQPSPELQPLPPLTGPNQRSSPATTLLPLHHASPDLQPLPPLSEPQQQSPQAKKLSQRQGDRSPPSTMSSVEVDSYHTAKDSAGNYFSPHRQVLRHNFSQYATTNTSSTTRSSTSTNSSTNSSTSSDGGMEHTYAIPCRGSSTRRSPTGNPNGQTLLRTAESPPLQPMTVPLQSPSSEARAPSPPRRKANQSSSSSAVAGFPFPPLTQKVSKKFQPPKAGAVAAAPSPPPPPPPPPPPTSRPSPLLRPPPPLSSIPVQPQHPILNKDRLPEPCPPPMAAGVQDAAKPPGNVNSKDGVTDSISTAPNINASMVSLDSSTNNFSEAENGNLRPRLKPLHWDKVRASADRVMVWDRLKSSSFKLDENMIEALFVCNPANAAPKEAVKKPLSPAIPQENRVLDSKKSQNIAILLRALNVTRDEVCEALSEGNPEGLGSELLETIVKMAPTKEEEFKLKEYGGDVSKLGPAERFLKAILDIPFAFKRIEALLYRINFEAEVTYLRKSFETLEAACEELRSSRLFLRLLEAVLKAGNRMNVGTNRGDAEAFKLDTLLKLVDIKGTDGKTTLLHFVVQEIIRSEGHGICNNKENQHPDFKCENETKTMHPKTLEDNFKRQGLQVVSGLANELSNVKKAAGMDSDVLSSYVSKLAQGLGKINLVLQLEDEQRNKGSDNGKFSESMKLFLDTAETEILKVKAEESVALSLVKEITEYFHGDAAKEEAHPFRIFMIVRDFMSTLNQVCKEVGRMQERTIMSSTRSFRTSMSTSLPSFPRFERRQGSSDDESLSS